MGVIEQKAVPLLNEEMVRADNITFRSTYFVLQMGSDYINVGTGNDEWDFINSWGSGSDYTRIEIDRGEHSDTTYLVLVPCPLPVVEAWHKHALNTVRVLSRAK
jgi:hypothetical protein